MEVKILEIYWNLRRKYRNKKMLFTLQRTLLQVLFGLKSEAWEEKRITPGPSDN